MRIDGCAGLLAGLCGGLDNLADGGPACGTWGIPNVDDHGTAFELKGGTRCLRSSLNGEEARLDGGPCVEEGAFDGVFGELEGKCLEGLVQILPERVYTYKISVVGERLNDVWVMEGQDFGQIAPSERGADAVSGLFERLSIFGGAGEGSCGWFELSNGSCSQVERYGRACGGEQFSSIHRASKSSLGLPIGRWAAMGVVLVVW